MREPVYLSFGEVVVNLDEGRLNRYLRMKLTLQVEKRHEEAIRPLIESHTAILKNWLIGHLSDKDTAEIRGAPGSTCSAERFRTSSTSCFVPMVMTASRMSCSRSSTSNEHDTHTL